MPAIAWWPGTIPAGSTCNEIATTMDLLPTFAALGGGVVPEDRIIDGKDITAMLLGKAGAKSPHPFFLYHHHTQLAAIRSGQWKLFGNGQLYNLDEDPGEQQNVAGQFPEVAERLRGYWRQAIVDLGGSSTQEYGENCRPVGRVDNPRYLEMNLVREK